MDAPFSHQTSLSKYKLKAQIMSYFQMASAEYCLPGSGPSADWPRVTALVTHPRSQAWSLWRLRGQQFRWIGLQVGKRPGFRAKPPAQA